MSSKEMIHEALTDVANACGLPMLSNGLNGIVWRVKELCRLYIEQHKAVRDPKTLVGELSAKLAEYKNDGDFIRNENHDIVDRVGNVVLAANRLGAQYAKEKMRITFLAERFADTFTKAKQHDAAIAICQSLDHKEVLTQCGFDRELPDLTQIMRYCVDYTNRHHANDDSAVRAERERCEKAIAEMRAMQPINLSDVSNDALAKELNRRIGRLGG